MSTRVPCSGGSRPAATPAEEAYAWAMRTSRMRSKDVAECSAKLKQARQAFDSAVTNHGPVSSTTEAARVQLLMHRALLKEAVQRLDAAEELQDAAFRAWAAEVAGRQYRTSVPSLGGAASFSGQVRPLEAGPPWHEEP